MDTAERNKTLRKLGAPPEIMENIAGSMASGADRDRFIDAHSRMVEEMKKGGLIPPDFKVVPPTV